MTGEEFKAARVTLGLKQKELAEIMGVDFQKVSNIETGTIGVSKTMAAFMKHLLIDCETMKKGKQMNKVYLSNAFSLQMVPTPCKVSVEEVSIEDVRDKYSTAREEAVSIIGHADTAAVVSAMLGFEVPSNRASIRLDYNDVLYVAQIMGGRLPEGCTELPEGVEIRFLRVELIP